MNNYYSFNLIYYLFIFNLMKTYNIGRKFVIKIFALKNFKINIHQNVSRAFNILHYSYYLEELLQCLRALSDERFLAAGGQAAFAMSHERFGRYKTAAVY